MSRCHPWLLNELNGWVIVWKSFSLFMNQTGLCDKIVVKNKISTLWGNFMCLYTIRYIYKTWVSVFQHFFKHKKMRTCIIYNHSCCLNVVTVHWSLRLLSANVTVYLCTFQKSSLEASGFGLTVRESGVLFGEQNFPCVSMYWNAFTIQYIDIY